jgi:hypothetical protein
MKRLAVCSILIVLATLCGSAEGLPDAEVRFAKLKSLAGSWKLTHPQRDAKPAFRISYKLISRDSALVETFGDPAGQVTETVYHLDGNNLMATHYCAQGNQPRLRMQDDSTDSMIHFAFQDVTNLKHEKDSHLIDMRFTLLADGRLKREETYLSDGQKDVSSLLLERADDNGRP